MRAEEQYLEDWRTGTDPYGLFKWYEMQPKDCEGKRRTAELIEEMLAQAVRGLK